MNLHRLNLQQAQPFTSGLFAWRTLAVARFGLLTLSLWLAYTQMLLGQQVASNWPQASPVQSSALPVQPALAVEPLPLPGADAFVPNVQTASAQFLKSLEEDDKKGTSEKTPDYTVSGGTRAGWFWIPWEEAEKRSFFRHTLHVFDGSHPNEPGLWGTPNIKVSDPKDYPHITSLDNDDPSSFFYTLRPNILGIPVPDEWDWLNMINTERPDFTDLTYTVGKGITYFESGMTFQLHKDAMSRITTRDLPEMLLRYGITDEFEVRVKYFGYYMIDQQHFATSTTRGGELVNFGTSDIDLTFKYELWQQHNWIPMNVLYAGALVPTGTRDFSGNTVQPHAAFIQGWGIKRWLYLKHEGGYNYLTTPTNVFFANGNSVMPNQFIVDRRAINLWQQSVSLIYHMSKHCGGFYEWYALFGPHVDTQNILDAGILFYPNPNSQFDMVIGEQVDKMSQERYMFGKFGFSTRW